MKTEIVKLTLLVSSDRDHIQGRTSAPVTLIEYGDYECPYCGQAYLKGDKPKIEILDDHKLDNNVSILSLRQHISCYRPKLISKIEDKYTQDEDHYVHIIIIDFRLAHFDSLSLKREIKTILDKGMEFPALG